MLCINYFWSISCAFWRRPTWTITPYSWNLMNVLLEINFTWFIPILLSLSYIYNRWYSPGTSNNLLTLMKFKVNTAVRMTMLLFWVLTPCRLVGRYKHFNISEKHIGLQPWNGDSTFLRNVGIYLWVYTASQPGGSTSSFVNALNKETRPPF
jgi:hypothetical protein